MLTLASCVTMEDFERLDAWYDAGAPDGNDWMPE